jgi:hypothetical protein
LDLDKENYISKNIAPEIKPVQSITSSFIDETIEEVVETIVEEVIAEIEIGDAIEVDNKPIQIDIEEDEDLEEEIFEPTVPADNVSFEDPLDPDYTYHIPVIDTSSSPVVLPYYPTITPPTVEEE